jgi:DNA-binding NtrC family response regulator
VAQRLLIVEDEPRAVAQRLASAVPGARICCVAWGSRAGDWEAAIAAADVVVAVLDDDMVPEAAPHRLRSIPPAVPVLAVVPERASDRLLHLAAATTDFLVAPVRSAELAQRLERIALRHGDAETERRLADGLGLAQLVGADPAFRAVMERLPLAARSESPVLLTGETGTGKEMCARAIHQLSLRRDLPFVAVDCGAFPDHLFENEFFGHVRGAYTDARSDQKGVVQMAERGTLLLDEVDALSLTAQAKLLRFLQERTYKPLGSERFVRADVRIMAASNRELEQAVVEKRFRRDLLFRLDVLRLPLVPLRQRPADVPLLARHFLRSVCSDASRGFSAEALAKLCAHTWPGNVRELANAVERACVFASGTEIGAGDIALGAAEDGPRGERIGFREARSRALAAFEREYVRELMDRHHGNVTRAAREAQKERRAFGRLVKKYASARASVEPTLP